MKEGIILYFGFKIDPLHWVMLEISPRGIKLDRKAGSDIAKEGHNISRFITLKSVKRFILFLTLNNPGLTKSVGQLRKDSPR